MNQLNDINTKENGTILVKKERLDCGITSINVGNSIDGHPIEVRIDKISIVGAYKKDAQKLAKRLNTSLQKLKGNKIYRVQRYSQELDGRNKKQYRKIIIIDYKNTTNKYKGTLLNIEFQPIENNKGSVRLEFSPQHLTNEEINELIYWLSRKNRLGKSFYKFLKDAWITRVDFAIDIYGCSLKHYYWQLKNARKGKWHDSEDGLDGLRLGSVKSLIHLAIYEKFDGRGGSKTEIITTEGKVCLELADYPRFLRTELRIKPKKKDVVLSNIMILGNNFAQLIIVYSPKLRSAISKKFPEIAELMHTKTLPEILILIKDRNKKNMIKRLMKKYEIDFFKNIEFYSSWHGAVQKLGIFGQPQLWGKKYR